MRRRDATDHCLHNGTPRRWPTTIATGLSLALHAVLLGAAAAALLSAGGRTQLIHVSLLPGGGNAAAVTEEHAGRTGVEAAEPAAPAPKPVRRRRAVERKAPTRNRPDTASIVSAAPAAQNAAAGGASSGAANGSGAAASAGEGTGVGHASGAGAGDGRDQRASCIYCPPPRYPLIARARGWEGSVDIGLLVLADGSVDAARLRRSSGYSVLDDAAIAVARQSRFSPPAAHGLPTPLRGRIEYRFELRTLR